MPFIEHRYATRPATANLLMLLCLTMVPGAWAQAPETPVPTRLSDLWLDQPALPAEPGYAYYLRQQHRDTLPFQAMRLEEELRTVADRLAMAGQAQAAGGVSAWRETLEAHQATRGRTPARADLAALLASPRHDPSLSSLAEVGHCEMPDWVELWSFEGVTRHAWTPGMGLQHLLRDQPRDHRHPAEAAWVVSPQSSPRRIGTSAWNADDTPLVPGSRITLEVPIDDTAADWINQALPAYLSTRLPGEACTTLPLPDDHGQAAASS